MSIKTANYYGLFSLLRPNSMTLSS